MILLFTLSMPGRNSWNGRWSGENRHYTLSKNFGRSQKAQEMAAKLVTSGSFYYRWDDGWAASIKCQEITPQQARIEKKRSDGFCGYDWMVDSILIHGAIYAGHDEIPKTELQDHTKTNQNK